MCWFFLGWRFLINSYDLGSLMKPNFKKPKIRSKEHREFVASQPCIITGLTEGVQAHHLLRASGKGMGTKACDSLCIPLHYKYHNDLHKHGDEILYLDLWGVDYEMAKDMAEFLCMKSPCKKIKEHNNAYNNRKRI